MATKTIDENPTISDTISFVFKTPDANGCFNSNPYKVNSVVFYFIERNFTSKTKVYENVTYQADKLAAAEAANAVACADPSLVNIIAAKTAMNEAKSKASINPFYYNDAVPVFSIGNDNYPAWLSTDLDNAFLDLIETDADGNPVYGQFQYLWNPSGMREGDYFVCWTWTPLIAGDSLSASFKFALAGDSVITTSIPTHFTDPLKYTTLLDRYLPEMYKTQITDTDRTPDVLDKFNKAIAQGFNTLENLANQIVDLQDSNSIAEPLLPYLSNLFNLKLKTTDPTRWRGQIKRAIPLFKMKGTKKGLAEAMEHAGINMLSLTQLWQIISSYTWQEAFIYDGSFDFTLEKVALDLDLDNFGLWIRPDGEENWVELTADYVEFSTTGGITTMTWVGNTLSVGAIDLIAGDEIRVVYLYQNVPDSPSQTIENYVRQLPLMDLRDERSQSYPPKNWNVRVIAENDPFFNLIITVRNPYADPLIYGKVRTEFPYSENIYNMEEYNGSIRNSKNPCDIAKEFIDPCSACISSCYNVDLEIKDLCDDRIVEAKDVLKENTPFHAVLHTFNFVGRTDEYVESPIEDIEALISIYGEEFVISGDAQMYFNRSMKLVETQGILRSDLASSFVALATTTGTAYNDKILMFCPSLKLSGLGISTEQSAILDIKSPSALSGEYLVDNPEGNTIQLISGSVEPIDDCNTFFASDNTFNTCAFTFDINNPVNALTSTLCDIVQDNFCTLSDTQNFGLLGVQSEADVLSGNASYAWTVLIAAYSATPYVINDILPDGSLVLTNTGTLPSSNVSNVHYTIKNGATAVYSGTTATLNITHRARVTALSSGALPVSNILTGWETFYQKIGSIEYLVSGFVAGTDDQYYLNGYNDGDASGVTVDMRQKIVQNQIGYLSHSGLKLKMLGNLETDLGIQNGVNPPIIDGGIENDCFMENFIVVIGDDSYWITSIDGGNPVNYTTIALSGPDHYWTTLTEGGTTVNVTIYQYLKNGATITGQQFDLPSHTFRTLDRNGRPVITGALETEEVVMSLNVPEGNMIEDSVQQTEGISYKIEYADGSKEEGDV